MPRRSSCLTILGGLGVAVVAIPVVVAGLWWAIFGGAEARVKPTPSGAFASQSSASLPLTPGPTGTPVPTATSLPAATPLYPITGPSAEELRTRWDDLTKAQQAAYQKELVGAYVRWEGKVVQVHADGTVNVATVVGTRVLASVFQLSLEEAELLNLDQEVTIEGTIQAVREPDGEGDALARLIQSRTLLAYLDNVTVLP